MTTTLERPATQVSTPSRNWTRPALWALLVSTAALYTWGLSGWANSFYSAAAQAGAENWEAFFFASSDAGNSITVDKPPAAIWVMAASVRLFGLNTWSILLPQALMGVASVWLLYLAVSRYFGKPAGLLAGTILATTPVAVLMFRFNNPDALLVLLLVAATYAVARAIEHERLRWVVLAAVAVGFAFLTKSLQAFLVLPAFIAAVAVYSRRRIPMLVTALIALVVSGGWWVAAVELWPEHRRGDRQRRWRHVGQPELAPDVRRRMGRADRLATAGRIRRDRHRLATGRSPHAARGHDPVGRLAVGHLGGVQLRQRNHP
ncbi:MAG: glycosyltransferase family 39 protein [Candidatus Nanopelagicales bacterium]|nr:glycosyltransferase family 39 protein [Candidatus Nanopelagicales bacterium]